MKIGYLLHLNLGPDTGVFKKIIDQSKYWQYLGHEITIFIITRNRDILEKVLLMRNNIAIECQYYLEGGAVHFLDRLRAFINIRKSICEYNPDLIYTRRDLVYPQMIKLAKEYPMVIEINSNEIVEYKHYSYIQYLYHLFTRRLLDKHVSGFITVTNELAKEKYLLGLKKRIEVISNGIDLSKYYTLPESNEKITTLVFLGKDYPWTGVDKIINLANIFKEWKFILIGDINKHYEKLNSNVIILGHLDREKYINWLKKAHVAIGPLALHRNNMNEGSPLKVREYLGWGLPVIAAYKDVDIPDKADYFLRLPNTEDNVNICSEQIKIFVERWKNKRVDRSRILHLDVSCKENRRVAFFEEIINEKK